MHIAIITGGNNSEREISLISGKSVLEALQLLGHTTAWYEFPHDTDKFLNEYKNIDGVMLMIHGVGGEDGVIAGFLETLGVPYHCAPSSVLALTMNKAWTKSVWRDAGVPVAQDELVDLPVSLPIFSRPCVLKALDQGSSVGVVICHTEADFVHGLVQLKEYGLILIEEFLEGVEITVPILEDRITGLPCVLPIVEIVPPEGMEFDYINKYNGKTKEICPARLPEEMIHQVNDIALRAYNAVGMKRYGRVDMIVTKDGPICLEINSIPGFTPQSLFPVGAKVYGLEFSELVGRLVQMM